MQQRLKQYKPNRTEVEWFVESHCFKCAFFCNFKGECPCNGFAPFLGNEDSFGDIIIPLNNPPKEWVWKNNRPTCMKYKDVQTTN